MGDISATIPTISVPGQYVSVEVKGVTIEFAVDEWALAYARARLRLLNKHMNEAGLPAPATLKGDAGRKRSRRLSPNLWAGMRCHLRLVEEGFDIYLKGRYRERSRQRYVNARFKTWAKQFEEGDHAEAVKRTRRTLIRRHNRRAAAAAAAGEAAA